MLDLHSHIIPGLDDGAVSYKEACIIIKQAYEGGVKGMVATPHFNYSTQKYTCFIDDFYKQHKELKKYLEEERIPVEIYLGMEIYACKNIPELIQSHKLLTINNSRYALIEFAFDESPNYTETVTEEMLKYDIIPVIAHPERYEFIQNDRRVAINMIKSGCLFQINKGSILGDFGSEAKRLSLFLLSNNLCHVIATDAHSPYQRTAYMLDIYEYICDYYTSEYADMLLNENPLKIVQNKNIFKEEMN